MQVVIDERLTGSHVVNVGRQPADVVTVGKHYVQRDVTEIAKLIRADIRVAVKAGGLPKDLKTSVRISRFSGGQSIDVTITHCRVIFLNPKIVRSEADGKHNHIDPWLTPGGSDLLKAIERIVASYNKSRHSNQPDDFFKTWFYSEVVFDYELKERQKAQILGVPRNVRIIPKHWKAGQQ